MTCMTGGIGGVTEERGYGGHCELCVSNRAGQGPRGVP